MRFDFAGTIEENGKKLHRFQVQVNAGDKSDYLVDYDIEDHPVPSPAEHTCPTIATCSSSSTSQYISNSHYVSFSRVLVLTTVTSLDPSLLTLEKDAQDCTARTSTSTPGSDRSRSPPAPRPNQKLNKKSLSELVGEASGTLREQELFSAQTPPGSDFGDTAFRELEEMELLPQSSHVRLGPSDRTNNPDPSMRSPLAGNEGPMSETVDASKDALFTGQLHTSPLLSGLIEAMGEQPSPRLASNTAAGGISELRGTDIAIVEEHAHQDSPGATPRDDCPQSPRTSSASSSWSPGASFSTPDTSTPATPTMTVSQQCSTKEAEKNLPSKRCPSERRLSKYSPTVEDAPEESECNAEELLDDSDEFGDLSIKTVLDAAHRFLGDTSGDQESPFSRVTNGAGANRSNSASASDLPESNHQYTLLSDAKGDITQVASLSGNQNTSRKRKLSLTAESQASLPTPNHRPRLRNRILQTTSINSDPDDECWDGRFSKHSILSTLSPHQKDEIERKCRVIIRSDLPEFIEKHTRIWKSTGFGVPHH